MSERNRDISIDEAAGIIYSAISSFRGIVEPEEVRPAWAEAPEQVQAKTMASVQFARENPEVTPEQFHNDWCSTMTEYGWSYGEEEDSVAKTHPLIVPFEELPPMHSRMVAFVLNVARILTLPLDERGFPRAA